MRVFVYTGMLTVVLCVYMCVHVFVLYVFVFCTDVSIHIYERGRVCLYVCMGVYLCFFMVACLRACANVAIRLMLNIPLITVDYLIIRFD